MPATATPMPAGVPLSHLERLIRTRVERDGATALFALRDDGRRCRELRRLFARLDPDPDVRMGLFDGLGYRTLTATPPGQPNAIFAGFPTD
jgi:hypothetical protein